MPELPTGTLTFLFTDIEGSTWLWEKFPDVMPDVIARHDLTSRARAVLLSPVHGELDPKTLSEWMLADHLAARLQLQLHKYIWSPTTRGV